MTTVIEKTIPGPYNVNGQTALGRRGQEVRFSLRAAMQETRDAAKERRSLLRTRQSILTYVKWLREDMGPKLFGPHDSGAPLNPRTFGTPLDRDGYTVEKVLFDAEPNFAISANLYLPDGASAVNPVPGVVELCGHWPLGKASNSYQRAAQGLARLGFGCLVVDDIGNGEREQGQLPSDSVVLQHLLIGRQLPLVGESITRQQVRDGRRGIDYLLSRPEIDATHIGITGNSGGGTQTVWIAAADDRITMAAPSCFVTDFLSNFDNEQHQDHEQFVPKLFALGLDMVDLLLMVAPNWLQMIGQEHDNFDRRGWWDIVWELRRLWEVLGEPDRFGWHMGPGSHGFHQDGREAMYTHFSAAAFGTTVPIPEPPLVLETTDSDFIGTDPRHVPSLLCTATGNVHDEPGALYLHDVNRIKVEAYELARGTPTGADLQSRIHASLRLPDTGREVPADHAYHTHFESITIQVITNPFTQLTGTAFPRQGRGAVFQVAATPWANTSLYQFTPIGQVDPLNEVTGKDAIITLPGTRVALDCLFDVRQWEFRGPDADWPDADFFAMDPLLTGETFPLVNGTYAIDISCSLFAMFDLSVLGIQVWELLRCIDLLHAHGYENIYLAGREHGAIVASIAAVLDARVTKCKVWNMLTRFRACAVTKPLEMGHPMPSLPHDVLLPTGFELSDIRAELTSRLGAEFVDTAPFGSWRGLGGET